MKKENAKSVNLTVGCVIDYHARYLTVQLFRIQQRMSQIHETCNSAYIDSIRAEGTVMFIALFMLLKPEVIVFVMLGIVFVMLGK
jgi:hypothetical protein